MKRSQKIFTEGGKRMKQMVAPQAPVSGEVPFWHLEGGFFRRTTGNREIFFGWNRAGAMYYFSVLEDGSISSHGSDRPNIYPNETIHVIHPSDLGIKELKWTEERASA
ncbi:MAG: hypothetical protein ABIG65_01880 [Patescibacteria group bacterium]